MSTILSILLTAVMTWTVQSKSEVSGEGTWPYDIEVAYSCTYQKGDVRQGDTATLTLGNIGGIEVQKVEVWLKSNKNSGAGTMAVRADGQVLAQRSGTLKEWTGHYDNESYQAVTAWEGNRAIQNELCIQVIGTDNSLHIEKFVVTYDAAPARTITLMNGTDTYATLTETDAGGGIQLPALPDRDEWLFAGWSEAEIWVAHETPAMHLGNQRYYPSSDQTLWAVWQWKETASDTYVAEWESGVYLYALKECNLALCGTPSGGKMNVAAMQPSDPEQWYYIERNAAGDSATIMHVSDGVFIGFSGTKIVEKQSFWSVLRVQDRTVFYTMYNEKSYVLFLNVGGSDAMKATLVNANLNTTPTLGLVAAQTEPIESYYTCHPESPRGCENVRETPHEVIVPIGVYELHIVDGKKTIRLSN